jgi:hypothetical protein
MNIDEKVKYWVHISDKDIPVMEHLYESGDYSYSLLLVIWHWKKFLKHISLKT